MDLLQHGVLGGLRLELVGCGLEPGGLVLEGDEVLEADSVVSHGGGLSGQGQGGRGGGARAACDGGEDVDSRGPLVPVVVQVGEEPAAAELLPAADREAGGLGEDDEDVRVGGEGVRRAGVLGIARAGPALLDRRGVSVGAGGPAGAGEDVVEGDVLV